MEIEGVKIEFPVISDPKGNICRELNFFTENELNKPEPILMHRTYYIIDPDGCIQFILSYPQSTGCNFYEIIRIFDALQHTYHKGTVTGANWCKGEDLIVDNTVPPNKYEYLFI